MIDVVLDEALPVAQAPRTIGDQFAAQTGWDPRTTGDEYLFLLLRPVRIQAWREENELAGRTLMRAGNWLV